MTAHIVVTYPDRVEALSDTAVHIDGKLAYIAPKLGFRDGVAFATRGAVAMTVKLHSEPDILAAAPSMKAIDPTGDVFVVKDGKAYVCGVLTDWQIVESPGFLCMTPLSPEEAAGFKFGLDDRLDDLGVEIMKVARRKPVDTCGIGGQLLHYTIRPGMAPESRALGYWPDMIGRPLDPEAEFVWR